MRKWLIVYSTVTGNTKKVAEAMAEAAGVTAVDVKEAPSDVSGYDIVACGYWLWRGTADPKTQAYLKSLHDANVVLFSTHAAPDDSEHAQTSFARAAMLLGGNVNLIGTFGCRGQVSDAVLARRAKLPADDPHKQSDAWKGSMGHPDEKDIENAKKFVESVEHKMMLMDKFMAKM
ncbi:MAG: flavodoxin family protein [Selenomonadaceae bacterium]